jgi:isocitrate lyase
MVIAKGYGRQLLALQTYHDEHYDPYNVSDGLTRDEIIALVNSVQNS